jgi:hypothetical protein
LTMISRGVEISIAGGVEEMVRAIPKGAFCFFLFESYFKFRLSLRPKAEAVGTKIA